MNYLNKNFINTRITAKAGTESLPKSRVSKQSLIKVSLRGPVHSQKILAVFGCSQAASVNYMKRVVEKNLTFKSVIKKLQDKKKQQYESLKQFWKHLFFLNTYKGARYKLNLPVRGQRTHTNAKTATKLNKV